MSDALTEKLDKLEHFFMELGSVAVAFSGGVDSSFLLAVAQKVCGSKALAVIGRSPTYPERECKSAVILAEQLGARYVIIDTDELKQEAFRHNPINRCYLCKTILFEAVWCVAREQGLAAVVEGSNADDMADFRPGMVATEKLEILSPLKTMGLRKEEIRELSKRMGLSTWNKPAMACLSSRIPYGDEISEPKLRRIEKAENALKDLGFAVVRVRDHGNLARVELHQAVMEQVFSPSMREKIVESLKNVGYVYVCLDLSGYRQGAMNEVLSDQQKMSTISRPKINE